MADTVYVLSDFRQRDFRDQECAVITDAEPALMAAPDCALISGIDFYGYTVFNETQVPRLLAEMRALAERSADEAARRNLGEIVEFVERRRQANRTEDQYVVFLGD
jgi:hypothetical protein